MIGDVKAYHTTLRRYDRSDEALGKLDYFPLCKLNCYLTHILRDKCSFHRKKCLPVTITEGESSTQFFPSLLKKNDWISRNDVSFSLNIVRKLLS